MRDTQCLFRNVHVLRKKFFQMVGFLFMLSLFPFTCGKKSLQNNRFVAWKCWTYDVSAYCNVSVRWSRNISTIHLVRNDRCLVNDNVHKTENVGTTFKVKQNWCVTVDYATLRQNRYGNCLLGWHDLCRELNVHFNNSLFHLGGDRKVYFNFISSSYKNLSARF